MVLWTEGGKLLASSIFTNGGNLPREVEQRPSSVEFGPRLGVFAIVGRLVLKHFTPDLACITDLLFEVSRTRHLLDGRPFSTCVARRSNYASAAHIRSITRRMGRNEPSYSCATS